MAAEVVRYNGLPMGIMAPVATGASFLLPSLVVADRVLVFSPLSPQVDRRGSQGLEFKKQEETSAGRRCCSGLAATWVPMLWSPAVEPSRERRGGAVV